MPISDLNVLSERISAANLTWRVRAVPSDEVHGLGADEPQPSEGVAAAEQLGQSPLSEVRVGNANVLAIRGLRLEDLLHRLRFRPSRFDWRDRGVVGPVTHQGHCGSCVSFATAGLVAAQAAIELGTKGLDCPRPTSTSAPATVRTAAGGTTTTPSTRSGCAGGQRREPIPLHELRGGHAVLVRG